MSDAMRSEPVPETILISRQPCEDDVSSLMFLDRDNRLYRVCPVTHDSVSAMFPEQTHDWRQVTAVRVRIAAYRQGTRAVFRPIDAK